MAAGIEVCRYVLHIGAADIAAEAWMMMKPLGLWVGSMEDMSRRHLPVR